MSCKGKCKSFNAIKGWGFIDYDGVDVFVHAKDCHGGVPREGDLLKFEAHEDPVRGRGELKATDVVGGSGPPDFGGKGKGKGKGKGGKGKYDGKGQLEGGKDRGKGFEKGYDKGYKGGKGYGDYYYDDYGYPPKGGYKGYADYWDYW